VTPRSSTQATDSSVDTASLEARLRDVLDASVRVVDRARNWRSSSATSEIVVVESDAGRHDLFLKYGDDSVDPWSGRTRGVPYEICVYERIVGPWEGIAPQCFGSWVEQSGSALVVEFVAGAKRSNDPERVVVAAAALGAWHARCARLVPTSRRTEGLNDFGPGIIAAIDERLTDVLDAHPTTNPLFERVLGRLDAIGERLADAEVTLVHGESYPANVLIAGRDCYLVDWETAGIGCGELDLAALTAGGWASATIAACDNAYAAARWPGGERRGFRTALAAARVLVHAELVWRGMRARSAAPAVSPSSARRLTELLAEVSP
jgi:aminoglycoside phosphotransferase (APT) family kinase protein